MLRATALAAVAAAAIPVLGALGMACWQGYSPGSLRILVHEVSALTEVEDARGMIANLMTAFDPAARHPG